MHRVSPRSRVVWSGCLIAVLAALGCSNKSDGPAGSSSATGSDDKPLGKNGGGTESKAAASDVATATPVYSGDAQEFFDSFWTKDSKAVDKYHNKVVELRGVVRS